MDKVVLLVVAVLVVGCTSMNDGSYMPSEVQVARQNPVLLDCPTGSVALCRRSVGRVNKSYSMCKCL